MLLPHLSLKVPSHGPLLTKLKHTHISTLCGSQQEKKLNRPGAIKAPRRQEPSFSLQKYQVSSLFSKRLSWFENFVVEQPPHSNTHIYFLVAEIKANPLTWKKKQTTKIRFIELPYHLSLEQLQPLPWIQLFCFSNDKSQAFDTFGWYAS